MKNVKSIFLCAVTGLLVAAFIVLGKCIYDRHEREMDAETMRLGTEDVARRIKETRDNLKLVTKFYDESALGAARAFAKIIACDPTVLKDQKRFDELKILLGVDEIHVSDSNGILIACNPTNSLRFNMASSKQSGAFMPAITNRDFALVQKPMLKGIESKYYQYAGVARIDEPGIVQIGLEPGRLESARSVADVKAIAASTRIGRGGKVEIRPLARFNRKAKEEFRLRPYEDRNGRFAEMSTETDGYRIIITMPYRGWYLANSKPFFWLNITIIALLVILFIIGLRLFGRHGLKAIIDEFRMLFETTGADARQRRTGPMLVITASVLIISVVATYFIARENFRSRAKDILERNAEDFIGDFDYAPDRPLLFVASAIVDRFPSPVNFEGVDLDKLLEEYNIDELNVMDENGVIAYSTVKSSVGLNVWNIPNTSEFCEELIAKGHDTFSQKFRESTTEKDVYRMYAGVRFRKTKGFIQIGFDEHRIEKDFHYGLQNLASRWVVDKSGFFIFADSSGEIISCGRKAWEDAVARGETQTLAGIGFDATLVPDEEAKDQFFEAIAYGESSLCLSKKLGNHGRYRMFVLIPLKDINASVYRIVTLVGIILLFILGATGVFGTRLSNLVRQLKKFIDDEKLRQEKDLEHAKAVQTQSLPMVFPDEPEYTIFALMDTAKEVGGDFYDFYKLRSGKIAFLIADTSGKAFSAAMFMMKSKAILHAEIATHDNLAEAISDANDRLAENNDDSTFVTAWIGAFDPGTGDVEFVNCGHNPPIIKHNDGSVTWVRTRPCPALAAISGSKFRSERIHLEPGESLLLYTDGITEAENAIKEQFGEPRLEAAIQSASKYHFLETIRSAVANFVAEAEQSDDITMLALGRKTVKK